MPARLRASFFGCLLRTNLYLGRTLNILQEASVRVRKGPLGFPGVGLPSNDYKPFQAFLGRPSHRCHLLSLQTLSA